MVYKTLLKRRYHGASTTFNTTADGGKPMIFWEQQNLTKQKKKKFGYKDKGLKHPLRPAAKEEPSAEQPKTRPPPRLNPASTTAKKPSNIKTAPNSKKTNSKKQSNDAGPADPNSVTLTQKQFDAILETIGQLALESETKNEGDARKDEETLENLVLYTDKADETSGQEPRSSPPLPPATPISLTENNQSQPVSNQSQPVSSQKQPDTIQSLPVTNQSQLVINQSPFPSQNQADNRHADGQISHRSPAATLLSIPPAHLTKAERKRLQWEAERAASKKEEEWNPWGRPGAGAPIRDTRGNLMTDYSSRQKEEVRQSLEEPSQPVSQHSMNQTSSMTPTPQASQSNQQIANTQSFADLLPHQRARLEAEASAQQSVTMATTNDNNSQLRGGANVSMAQNKGLPPPAAIRSSFAIGDAAPNELRFESAKERQKREWLQELEKQREEQRIRKKKEHEYFRGSSPEKPEATWADKFTRDYKPKPLPGQSVAGAADNPAQRINSAPTGKAGQTQEVDGAAMNLPGMNTVTPTPSTFIRGQNVPMDPATYKEMEEKRRKHLEHQEYIKQQMEEKAQLKRAERERRIREEQEEERKLAQEREKSQAFQDQKHTKSKEEVERMRMEDMKAALERAKEEAEMEKHQRRMQRLQAGGHDVSGLNSNFEAKHTPRQPKSHRASSRNDTVSHVHLYQQNHDAHHVVEPSFVPGLDLSPRGYVQMDASIDAPMENGIPTPSTYRAAHNSVSKREFGIQTEVDSDDGHIPIAREITGTDIEFKGPFKKKVRVKSAPKEAKPEKTVKSAPVAKTRAGNIKNRPKWGYQNPTKKQPVKQSEKDPFYERKKQQSDLLKEERQKSLLALADRQSPRTAQTNTVASRARSQSRDRKDQNFHKSKTRVPSVTKVASPSLTVKHQDYDNFARDSHREKKGRQSRTAQRDPAMPNQGSQSKSPPVPSILNRRPSKDSPTPAVVNHQAPSPPIPTLKHKLEVNYDLESHNFEQFKQDQGRQPYSRAESKAKYVDDNPSGAPVVNGDFVPFIRTNDLLDPSRAHEPLPVSREPTAMTKGRQAYVQEHNPAKYGKPMDNYRDPMDTAAVTNDPILKPGLVKDHPTTRQGQILQQLSDLRRGLMQKQRELEVGLAPTDNVQVGVA